MQPHFSNFRHAGPFSLTSSHPHILILQFSSNPHSAQSSQSPVNLSYTHTHNSSTNTKLKRHQQRHNTQYNKHTSNKKPKLQQQTSTPPTTQLEGGANQLATTSLQTTTNNPHTITSTTTQSQCSTKYRTLRDLVPSLHCLQHNNDTHNYDKSDTHHQDNHTSTQPSVTHQDMQHNHQPTTTHTKQHNHPFKGNFSGISWNAESLMCASTTQQGRKLHRLKQLCADHDFCVLAETHGTEGKAEAYTIPQNTTPFWSHKDATTAGIGCLVKDEFLKRFQHAPTWKVFMDGYLARLSLKGMEGGLDIWCVYMPTGHDITTDRRTRGRMIATMAANSAPAQHCLTIMVGDWNFAASKVGRLCLSSGHFTGDRDKQEADHFNDTLLSPHGFHELEQDNFTYHHPISLSRLDRVYSNHHPSSQLDNNYHCNTMTHLPQLSKHAPLSFGRSSSCKTQPHDTNDDKSPLHFPPIKTSTLQHPDWKLRVSAEYYHQLHNDNMAYNPLRRLLLLKNAIRQVSDNIQYTRNYETDTSIPQDNTSKLNATMGFIKAAVNNNLKTMQFHSNKYKHIHTLINTNNPLASTTPQFWQVQDHAVSLAREIIADEAKDLNNSTLQQSDPTFLNKKQNLLVKLKKLYPGSTTGIGAIEDDQGNIHTDHMGIINTLTTHWQNTFQATPIDRHTLTHWLDIMEQRTATDTPLNSTQPNSNYKSTRDSIHELQPPAPHTSTINEHKKTSQHTHKDNKTTQPHKSPNNNNIIHSGPHLQPRLQHPRLPQAQYHWNIRYKHIKLAVDTSNNSSPGPDGIPFQAWRNLGHLANETLLAVTQALSKDNFKDTLTAAYHDTADDHPHHYNYSFMACLPKKSHSTTHDGTPIFTANNTRPLNVVNTDNRIVASAARNCWETNLADWILPRQQGFLRGRSILQNLFDVDTASMHTSLMHDHGACILLDFSSAFPSISQDYMQEVLNKAGLPANVINFIQALYDESYCRIQHQGSVGQAFHLRAGVRQGCPLSPMIYALVAEVLMDNIEHHCPGTLTRAYADDTALVVENLWEEGPILANLFQDFEKISGLQLNLTKCVIIPLSHTTNINEQTITQHIPQWQRMKIKDNGKYLGFVVGPGKGDKSWEEPSNKYINRCKQWQDRPIGLHFSTLAYNSFSISTLSYIAQLEIPPNHILDMEQKGLHLTISGPGGISKRGWATSNDLWRLKEDFGQQSSCRSLSWMCEASHTRVYLCDPACNNPQFSTNLRHLQRALQCPNNLPTYIKWKNWYHQSFAATITRSYNNTCAEIGDIRQTPEYQKHFTNTNDNNDTTTQTNHKKKQQPPIQKMIYQRISQHRSIHSTERIRQKIKRWQLHNHLTPNIPPNTPIRHLTPNWQAQRITHLLEVLKSTTTPRVRAAVFGTIWNRWNTHRRWQRKHHKSNHCLFQCKPTADDSIEHYCCCNTVKTAMRRFLKLDPFYFANIHTFTLSNTHIQDTETLTTIALLIYGTYTTTNQLRYDKQAQQHTSYTNYAYDMLIQNIRNGAINHPKSSSTLDHRFAPNNLSTAIPCKTTRQATNLQERNHNTTHTNSNTTSNKRKDISPTNSTHSLPSTSCRRILSKISH